MTETFGKDDTFQPFSNGHAHRMWLDANCCRGKGCRNYRPDAPTSRHGCPIEVAVAMGAATDGEIPVRIGLRGAWLEPAPNGRLQRVETDPPGCELIPACPEYRGRDEPDDRPRRGPRPPKEQLDLLDPRNVPDRPRVVA